MESLNKFSTPNSPEKNIARQETLTLAEKIEQAQRSVCDYFKEKWEKGEQTIASNPYFRNFEQ